MSIQDNTTYEKVRVWGSVQSIKKHIELLIPSLEGTMSEGLLAQARDLLEMAECDLASYSKVKPPVVINDPTFCLYFENQIGNRHLVATYTTTEENAFRFAEGKVDLMERNSTYPEGHLPVLVGCGKAWILSDDWEEINS